jgi:hypothetical protein
MDETCIHRRRFENEKRREAPCGKLDKFQVLNAGPPRRCSAFWTAGVRKPPGVADRSHVAENCRAAECLEGAALGLSRGGIERRGA